MRGITVGRKREFFHCPHLLESMHRLRHKVFYEKLCWEVSSDNGCEVDSFDRLDPVYMVSSNSRGDAEGSWRLLPTNGPYMLKDTFPQLLRGEHAPQAADIWEISRFAVSPVNDSERVQANLNEISFAMIRAAYEFAVENGIRYYVFATSVALERLFRTLGLPVYRFGDLKSQRIGRVLSVGCWLPINEQFRCAIYGNDTAAQPLQEAV